MSGFAEARVSARVEWAPGLFTLQLAADTSPHVPGQFANLALSVDGELVKRPYSMSSATGAPLEFFLTTVASGVLSRRLAELRVGDGVLVEKKPQGFFTLDYVPAARDAWLVATGTGLGPFISMLRSGVLWPRFSRVVVVHGVRSQRELAYRAEIEALVVERAGQLSYLPALSRESDVTAALDGRVTTLLDDGRLEARAKLALSPEGSHVLLCGNPAMIGEMSERLAARGLQKHRPRKTGHVSFEKYW